MNIKIIKCKDGTILTDWHRKDTYSGRFINLFSNHPIKQKSAIIKNLVDSAILLSHHSFHQKNLSIVKKLLSLKIIQLNSLTIIYNVEFYIITIIRTILLTIMKIKNLILEDWYLFHSLVISHFQ